MVHKIDEKNYLPVCKYVVNTSLISKVGARTKARWGTHFQNTYSTNLVFYPDGTSTSENLSGDSGQIFCAWCCFVLDW